MLEYMELLAVFEASNRRMLPAKYAALSIEELQTRLSELRIKCGARRQPPAKKGEAMAEFFPEVEVRPEQAEAIGRGLFAVARADGQIHEREASLINEFFASISGQASNLGALERM